MAIVIMNLDYSKYEVDWFQVHARWVPRLLKDEEKRRRVREPGRVCEGSTEEEKHAYHASSKWTKHGYGFTIRSRRASHQCGRTPDHPLPRKPEYARVEINTCSL